MTSDIKVVFTADDLAKVNIGGEDAFSLIIRTSKDLPEWSDDAATASKYKSVRLITLDSTVILRIGTPLDVLAECKNETSSLQCDMLHGRDPGISVVGGGSAV